MEQQSQLIKIKNDYISNIFGQFDENIKKIEDAFNVVITNRLDAIKIVGATMNINFAAQVINSMIGIAEKGDAVTLQAVSYLISIVSENNYNDVNNLYNDYICMTITGRKIMPKTIGQKKYIDSMRNNTIVFGIGPAGTGKTYLAMAMAITAFKNNEVARIILTRPAIEAGEKLGFLPGDLQQKVDPYLRPLYDALYDIMGTENFVRNMEKGAIEVAPLAYMRGRTLDNSFIVLDEAQNTTFEQMKMFLTRIGYGSKMVITGDISQIDLPLGKGSGLVAAVKILKDIKGIDSIYLTNKDVVRHPLVGRIISAYESFEKDK